MLARFFNNILWGNSIALAWTWGIGLFFSVQMAVQYGFTALVAYVTVNALGLALFGIVNEFIAKKYKTAEDYERAFLKKAQNFKFPFFFYQFVAITLTLFACLKYVTLPLGILSFLVAVMFIGSTIFLGEEFKIDRIKYSHAFLGLVMLGAMIYILNSGFMLGSIEDLFSLQAAFHFNHDIDYVALAVPITLGFLFGPWLDLQHWQRAIQIRKEGGSIAKSYITGGLIFWCILIFDGALAISAYAQSPLYGFEFSFLDSFKSVITDVTHSMSAFHGVLNAYVVFICVASLTTFDSGYIAFQWFTEPQVKNSKSILLTFFPPKLVSSPIPWFFLCIVTATITMHFAEVGKFVEIFDDSLVKFFRFELEYYLAFYASFFIMYEVTFIRCMLNTREEKSYSVLKLFSTGLCSISIFGIGYFSQHTIVMAFASLVPLVYGVMTSDSFGQSERKADIEDSSSVLPATASQVLSSITAEPQALSSLDGKSSLLGLSNISTESINALNVLNLPADAKLISTSSCYISDGFFVHEMTPTYQDTNSVGNVYFAMYTLWVGKTRELFFLHTMPDFDLETTDFLILTRSFNHKYLREIKEFESVSIHLRIKDYNRKFVTIEHKILNKDKQLIGKGDQSLMFVDSKNYALIDIPNQVMEAHLPFYYGDKSPKA